MTERPHLLIDLDGTLLGMDIDRFLPAYMDEISRYAAGRVGFGDFPQRFAHAVADMLGEHPGVTNEAQFRTSFFQGVSPAEQANCEIVFSRFYEDVFPDLRRLTETIPGALRMVTEARRRGYVLTLATSPVFPLVAIEERVRWAGIDPGAFARITSVENSRFAKPDPRYYREVLDAIGASPEQAVMIGNDLSDDGAAAQVGIGFLHVQGPYSRGAGHAEPMWQGSMAELAVEIERGRLLSGS